MRKPIARLISERFLLVAVLVLLTYNIWGYSYYHWLLPFEGFDSPAGALKVLAGIILAVLYIALGWATWRAKGPVGIGLLLLVIGGFIYVAWANGLIDFQNPHVGTVLAQIIVVLALTIGSVWSILWRRWTGHIRVEDADTESADT